MCTISKSQFCIKLKEAITQEEPSGVAGNHESGKICEMFCKTFKSHMAVWPELKAACAAKYKEPASVCWENEAWGLGINLLAGQWSQHKSMQDWSSTKKKWWLSSPL